MPKTYETTVKVSHLKLYFLIAVVLFIFNSLLLLVAFNNMRDQQMWIQHTNYVRAEIERVLATLNDAESNARGYIISQRPDYLEEYNNSVRRGGNHIRTLRSLTVDNNKQQLILNDIEKTLEARLEFLGRSMKTPLNLIQKSQASAAPLEGKVLMDTLRLQLDEMRSEEQKLYDSRVSKAEQSEVFGLVSWLFTVLINLSLTGAAYYYIRRNYIAQALESRRQSNEAWTQSKIAEVSGVMASDLEVTELGQKILGFLSEILNFPVANLYVLEGDTLHHRASYAPAMNAEDMMPAHLKKVRVGSTLLGEAIQRVNITEVSNVPENYLWIESSLGRTRPRSLMFIPIRAWGKPVAVIEVALVTNLKDEERNFINEVLEVIGSGITSAKSKEDLRNLLTMTQEQALELQAQQEELRASNEELEEQARTLESQQEALNSRNKDLEIAQRDVQAKATDLEKTNQYKSEFLAKMSHELRTPLNSLLILATLLKENKEGNLTSQQIHFASTIHDSGNDLLNLISDILDLSKIDARKLVLRREAFTLENLLLQLQATFMPQINKKSLRFVMDLKEDIRHLEMHTDLQRLEQVLRNFLANAIKFTDKGSVTLKAVLSTRNPGNIVISVTDTGIGITDDKKGQIFEAFEQADSSISRRFGGTGLGLAIAKELTQLLGGQIYLESESNHGSTFAVDIPCHLPGEHKPAGANYRDSHPANLSYAQDDHHHHGMIVEQADDIVNTIPAQAKTLLLVEDDMASRSLISQTASAYGFKVLEAESGELGLAILKKHTPTAIMLDIKLPGISGMGMLESIKRMPRLRHVPVHMISALDYQQNTMRMGALGFLGKPLSMEGVQSAIRHIEEVVSEKSKKLLVIEDDAAHREAIVSLIQGEDITIASVGTGSEALNLLTEQTFDCIVLDLSLPDMVGSTFLSKLSALEITLPPVIIYTGQDLSREDEESLRRYAESIILKGVRSPERLLDEVNLFLHRVEDGLPLRQQDILKELRGRDASFEGRTVLLVDDDIRNVFSLTHVLESKGFKVVVARDGVEAVERLEDTKGIDVVLMDIMMPRMDGYEATRKIRKSAKFGDVPVIALTAKAMRGDHEKCIEAGANDYLPKPIDVGSLTSVLKVWVQTKESLS